MNDSTILVILCTILLGAFFSGIEIAYLTANKLSIELKSQKGNFSARLISFFVKRPSFFFTTTLVGNNIAIVVYSIYSSSYIERLLVNSGYIRPDQDSLIFVLQTIISSIFILIFGEFIPKAVFRSAPNTTLSVLALPYRIFYYLMFPLVMLIDFLSRLILGAFTQMRFTVQTPEYDRQDLFHYVTESQATNEERALEVDKQIFKNAIEFPSIQVRDCMIPRTEIEAIEVSTPIDEVRRLFIESGHSKLLVYKDNIDNIIGYIHVVDLYRSPKSVDKMVMPIMIATESMPASDLMRLLIEKRRSVAVVVDEFGGTSGMITIEDVIEEIIGDIEDEYDVDDTVERKINDNEFVFSARLEIDYINEKYNLNLPEGDYDTLGGLIFFVHQDIPLPQTVIECRPYIFTVLSTEQARIKEVKVQLIREEE